MTEWRHSPSVAILASYDGTTAEAFIHATQNGIVDAEVELVICNNSPEKAEIYERIKKLNKLYSLDIESVTINRRTHPSNALGRGQTLAEASAICEKISKANIAHVALMGYMKQVKGELVEEYGWLPNYTSIYQARMSNTHNGPLPETEDTYNIHIHERVLDLGLTESKHTLHLVSSGIDKGPIIAEHPFDVFPNYTAEDLMYRAKQIEKRMLPIALNNFLVSQREYLENKVNINL